MRLMRLGPVGAERPVVRFGETTYVDVSDVVEDFDGPVRNSQSGCASSTASA